MHVCEMKPQAEAVTPAMDVAVGDDYRHPCVQTTVHCTVYTSRCKTIVTLTILVCRPLYTSRCKTGQTVQLQMQEYGHTLKRETCVHLKMQTWVQTIAFFVNTYFTVHSVVVHWAFTSTSVMGSTIGTLISHCAKFFRWHILLVAHIVAHIACSSEAAEGGYELADGFPARGRRLSFWQRTDLWIHNAYVNPQMVPLDTSPDSAPLSCSGIFKDCTSFLICVCLKAHTNSAACVWSSWLIRPSQENVEKNDWPRVLGIY